MTYRLFSYNLVLTCMSFLKHGVVCFSVNESELTDKGVAHLAEVLKMEDCNIEELR